MPHERTTAAAPKGATVEFAVHFRNGEKGRRRMRSGSAPRPPPVEPGSIPRISRLLALAIHFDGLIRRGVVRDYANLARLGSVSRARVTQIMDLLNLCPQIQEELLFLPRIAGRSAAVSECQLRPIAGEADWGIQRLQWNSLLAETQARASQAPVCAGGN